MTQKADTNATAVQTADGTGNAGDADHEVTVYYDGSCPLCTAEIGHYGAQAGSDRLRFVDVSAAGTEPGPDLAREDAMGRFHVRRSDGTLLSGARAFAVIWETLPGWRWAARLARIPGVVPVLEVAYRLFLPIRPAVSRLAAKLGARAENSCSCPR